MLQTYQHSLDTGDLVFNTTASELRVYNGSSWQGGVTATGNLISKNGDTFLGNVAGSAYFVPKPEDHG